MSQETVQELSQSVRNRVKTIAVVGASDKQHRPVYGVMRFLQNRGYKCIPVNPRLQGQEILGEETFARLADIPQAIDMVDIFRNPEYVRPIVEEAITVGAKVIWMQLGVIDDNAAALAQDAGLDVIMDRCPAIDWR